jgi:hypothetical protein
MTAALQVKELDRFVCEVSGLDHVWNFIFPDRAGK